MQWPPSLAVSLFLWLSLMFHFLFLFVFLFCCGFICLFVLLRGHQPNLCSGPLGKVLPMATLPFETVIFCSHCICFRPNYTANVWFPLRMTAVLLASPYLPENHLNKKRNPVQLSPQSADQYFFTLSCHL